MTPFTFLHSKAIPLVEASVDTDQIIPAQLVNSIGDEALAAAFFAGRRSLDPSFVLNLKPMKSRAIMLVGTNFGCGSSREAAVWAAKAWGIRCFVGLSFHPTFESNCLQNGVLPVVVTADIHAKLCDCDEEYSVDLENGYVEYAGISFDIQIDPFSRALLIRGIDELDYLLERRQQILEFEKNDFRRRHNAG